MSAIIVIVCFTFPYKANNAVAETPSERAEVIVQKAVRTTKNWKLPPAGPKASSNKTVTYLADNLLNGGILGVGEGVTEAADVLGWKVRVIDTLGNAAGRDAALRKVTRLKPDGLILGSLNAGGYVKQLATIAGNGTKIVGWHAAATPGPIVGTPVRFNVATDPIDVGVTAASFAVVDSKGTAGVVVFTDADYEIALAKSDAMAEVIRRCGGCTLLSVENVSLAKTAEIMPGLINDLLRRYGDRWTHTLGINDLYFDFAAPTLAIADAASAARIANISAGDGSASAYGRIRAGSFQVATVPEPLTLHGWQLIDELNRAFVGAPPSGYIAPVRFVLPENVNKASGDRNTFDPINGYRDAYRASWGR